jgi:hypothetical protein
MNRQMEVQVPVEIPVEPNVQVAPEDVSLPPPAVVGVSNVPQPRMKPPFPRNLRPRLASSTARPPRRDIGPQPDALASAEAPAKEPEGVRIAPGELVGSDFSAVLEVLRKPDAVENSALTVVWTYSESDCMLRLFFYPDIQTTTFHVLKYDLRNASGERLDDNSPCMQHLTAMKNDESPGP